MRQLWMICLLTLPIMTGIALGQSRAFPPCSHAELALVQGWETDYDQLIVRAESATKSEDKVLDYSNDMIDWRERHWSQLPRCAEAIEFALLLSENIDEVAAAAVHTYARTTLSPIPFDEGIFFEEQQPEQAQEQFEQIDRLIASGERPMEAPPADRGLLNCSAADIDRILLLQAEHEVLARSAFNSGTIGDLLLHGKALLDWRERLWDSMSLCINGFEIGWLLSRTAVDMISDMSLRFAGVSLSKNPYAAQLTDDFNRLKGWINQLEAAAQLESATSPQSGRTNRLPECAESQLASLADDLSGFIDLTKHATEISTTDDYLLYAAQYLLWRDQLWESLPNCSQALEIGRVASQAAGDISSFHGLYLGGASPLDHEAWTDALEMFSVVIRLSGALSDLAAQEDVTVLDSTPAFNLPRCTKYETGFVFDMLDELNILATVAGEMDSSEDLLEFSIVQFAWRDNMWTSMPVCKPATELAWQMIQITADTISAAALEMFTHLAPDENPYLHRIEMGQQRIVELVAELEGN